MLSVITHQRSEIKTTTNNSTHSGKWVNRERQANKYREHEPLELSYTDAKNINFKNHFGIL